GDRFLGGLVDDVVLGHLLQRQALGLRHQQRHEHTEEVCAGEHEERVPDADAAGVSRVGIVLVLRSVQEPERADDRAGLAGRGGDAVARRPEPRREDLSRHDEGGAVGPEVGEEEGECVEHDEAGVVRRVRPVVVGHAEREHEHGHHEEAHDLDPEPADDVDEGDGEPVARDGSAECDECLGAGDAVEFLERVHGLRRRYPPDLAEDVLLEQVLAVEGDVEQEPRAGGRQEVHPVALHELP
ncbi:Os03g0150901, partial [Oryza sativa Japonica Group]